MDLTELTVKCPTFYMIYEHFTVCTLHGIYTVQCKVQAAWFLPECFHVGVQHSLIHGCSLGPAALELGNQLLIHRTPDHIHNRTLEEQARTWMFPVPSCPWTWQSASHPQDTWSCTQQNIRGTVSYMGVPWSQLPWNLAISFSSTGHLTIYVHSNAFDTTTCINICIVQQATSHNNIEKRAAKYQKDHKIPQNF